MRRVLATAAVCVLFAACSGAIGAEDEDAAPLPPRGEAGIDRSTPPPPPPPPPPIEDAGSDTGVDASTPACDGGPSCERVVFVTKSGFNGNQLGGIAGADAKCNTAAAAPNVHPRVNGRIFRAWISTTTIPSSVKDRLVHGTGHYVKPTGTIIATDWTDLTDGTLQSGIDVDETGGAVAASHAWTGTTDNGSNGPNQCDGWTPSGGQGRAGNVGGAGNGWTDANDDSCPTLNHLYCFEQ
jgi:hypothetical protein